MRTRDRRGALSVAAFVAAVGGTVAEKELSRG